MHHLWLRIAACLLLVISPLPGQKKKNQEPKTQVLPLPKELPMALEADTATLDFHISPLLKSGKLSAQIRESLNNLIRDTRGETIIRLRALVAGAGDARRVQAVVSELFTEHRLPLPVLSILQVGALGDEAAQVVIEAVVATRKNLNPDGLAFVAGQTAGSFEASLKLLKSSLAAASIAREKVLTVTCFSSRFSDFSAMRESLHVDFPNSENNIVQALRDPPGESSTCEAIGQLSQLRNDGPVVILDKARTTLVNTPKLIFTGLQLTFGNYLDDADEAYRRLERAATVLDPIQTPVLANAFSIDAATGAALRKKSPIAQSVFTVQPIEGLPAIDASAGLEVVLAAGVGSAVTVK